ncbi:tetratricopeptide repeat-containing sensor histidine kinase [uncultured Cyclobacterium sp.]|uniref:tetratricopeptide repeat-containing sensor histidine kinase n=1 Tax=uncultured Cyclobacterium sp. TaxID=453820 RepID=UPI0030EF84DD
MKKRRTFVFNLVNYWQHFIIFFICTLIGTACNNTISQIEEPSPEVTAALENASIILNNGKLNHSFHYFDSIFTRTPNKTYLDLWEGYNFYATHYLKYEFDLIKAEQYLDSMYYVLKKEKRLDNYRYVQTRFMEGDILKANHKFNKAFQNFYSGREYALENLDNCNVSNLTYRLGIFRYDQKQYQEAIPFFKKAIEENRACWGNGNIIQNINEPQLYRNTMALCYERMEKYDSAAYYYVDALAYLEVKPHYPEKELFINSAIGVVKGNLGGVMAQLGNRSVAKNLLKSSISINSQPNYDHSDAQTAKLKLADIYIKNYELAKAKKYLDELDKELPQAEIKDRKYYNSLLRWYLVKEAYFEKVGDTRNALNVMKSYHHLNDSLQLIDNNLKFIDIEGSFRNAAQKYELSILNKDNKIKNIYLATAAGFTILLTVFLIVNWYNLKKSIKANNLILQNNNELQDTLNALELSQAENAKIMYMVAHDLRNPIGSTLMIANLILEDPDIKVENKYLLENIKTSCNNSMNLITEMLLPNKKENKITKESVEIDRLLKYCVEILNHKAQEKHQKILLDIFPASAFINKEKMWRVLTNLIANAIKFTPGEKTINILMKSANGNLTIIIKDEGIGIPNSIKDQLFEWDTMGKREGTNGEKPFGMGLAISRQIINAHQGKIWFESQENKGSTFYVEFPIKS